MDITTPVGTIIELGGKSYEVRGHRVLRSGTVKWYLKDLSDGRSCNHNDYSHR